MNPGLCKPSLRGLTLVEVLVVIATMVVLIAVLLPLLNRGGPRSKKLGCTNHLKQLGLAYRIFATDNDDNFPWSTSTNSGGTMQIKLDPVTAYRHFQAISNELANPSLLCCPVDSKRRPATNWVALRNRNISYFVGIDSVGTFPQQPVSGDSDLMTNGVAVGTGILSLGTNVTVGWTAGRHQNSGNILLGDGSVQRVTSAGLSTQVTSIDPSTNRILIP